MEIRLRFHNHAPQQFATLLALHQQGADLFGGKHLSSAGEEGLDKVLEGLVAMVVALRDLVENH